MKNFNSMFKTAALAAVVAATSAMVMNGCKNPVQDINVAIATETLMQSPTLVKFVKANPDQGAALPASITVTIDGPGKDFVQTDDGSKTFVASNGVLPISLNRFATPSVTNPVVFTISATVAGYAPVAKKVTITGVDEVRNIELPLVSYTAPAEGIAVVEHNKALTAGVVTAETTIGVGNNASTPQAVELTLPAGTQVQDANKQPIAATELKSTVVYYSTADEEGLRAAAPMLTAVNPIGPNNQAITGEVSFVTAGAVTIDMKAGNTPVKNFSKPMEAEIEINPALINPKTGVAVKAGDVIPVWSMNDATGQWTYEGTSTVTSVGGKLIAVISISHLSTWGLNWWLETPLVNPAITFNFASSWDAYLGYRIQLLSFNGQPMLDLMPDISQYFNSLRYDLLSRVYTFHLPTRLLPGNLTVYHGDYSSDVLQQPITSFNNININIPATEFTDFVDTDINFTAKCSNKKMIAYPTTWFVLKDVTDNTSTDQHLVDGKISLKLKNGHTYSISAVYDEKTYNSENVTIDKAKGVNVNSASGLKVTGAYNSGTKRMALEAEFTASNCK